MGGKPSKKGDAKAGVVTPASGFNSTSQSEAGDVVAPKAAEADHVKMAATDDGWRPGSMNDAPVKSPSPPPGAKPAGRKSPRLAPQVAPQKEEASPALSKPTESVKREESSMGWLPKPAAQEEPKPITVAGYAKAAQPEPAGACSLDVPADEFTRILTEAFGPMIPTSLMATKWDKRSNALKGVGTVLKGLSLGGEMQPAKGLQMRDGAQCFQAACLVLNRAMRDKVLPVQLAAHELFRDAFTQAAKSNLKESDLREAMSTLLPHALVKLGDSNIRLHESSKEIVNFCAEQSYFGMALVLSQLRGLMQTSSKGHARAKTLGGVVDAVNSLVSSFPGQRPDEGDEEDNAQVWTHSDIFPFISGGLEDVVGPRTRTNSANLAVTVFCTLGRDAMNPLLETLRPAVKNLLLERFQEAELGGDAAFDEPTGPLLDARRELDPADTFGLVISGTSCRIPAQGGAGSSSSSSRNIGASPKWKSDFKDAEESFMDEILEEAGVVFATGDKMAVGLDEELIDLETELRRERDQDRSFVMCH